MQDPDPTPHPPRLNEPAPDFAAETTQGHRRLEDYAGRWLVLFSHPADFTPVCTSEFVAFARMAPRFEALDCDLLGLSVDSRYAHIAWVRNIEKTLDRTTNCTLCTRTGSTLHDHASVPSAPRSAA